MFVRSAFFLRVVPLLAIGLVIGAAACAQLETTTGLDSAAGDPNRKTGATPAPNAGSSEPSFMVDAGAETTSFRGNPLCHVDEGTCLPDDDGYNHVMGVEACAEPAPDGGAAGDAGITLARSGCRLQRIDDGVVPKCVGATPTGLDGDRCTSGASCAPGFDCVEESGGLFCRRYCCLGTCEGQLARNGGKTFCDVRRLVEANHTAPVCMPLKVCELFDPGGCNDDETCAVVTEEGDTGCVPAGPTKAGDSCDADRCASGLTCLGTPGARKCYRLCKVGESCGDGETCQTSAVFKDPAYGVCTKP